MTQHFAHRATPRATGRTCLPCAVGLGRRGNPFKRDDEPASAGAAHAHRAGSNDLVEVFAAWRE